MSRAATAAPLPWRLLGVALIFLAVTVVSVFLTFAAIGVQSAVRSSVAGEGEWSKAQRDAVFSLFRYGQSGDPRHYRRFEEALAVPLAIRDARIALQRPGYDADTARRGLLAGGTHPDDIGSLIHLFRCCSSLPRMRQAIDYWELADDLVLQLREVGRDLHRTIGDPAAPGQLPDPTVEALLAQVEALNDAVHPLAAGFTETIGDAARRVSLLLMLLTATMIVLLVSLGTHLALRILRSVRTSEAQYRMLMHSASDGLIVVDRSSGLVLEVNRCAERLIGHGADDLVGRPYRDLFSGPVVHPLPGHEQTGAQVTAMHRAGGGPVDVEVNCSVTRWAGRGALLAIVRDIGERLKTERLLRVATNAMANMSEAVIITDQRFRILSVNRAFTAITGFTEQEMIGRLPGYLNFRAGESVRLRDMLRTLHREGRWQGELQSVRRDGERYPQMLSLAGVRDGDGRITHYVGLFTDNSAFRDYERRLRHLANHDMLTALPNRTTFEERTAQAIRHAQLIGSQLALLFIDLDGFKTVNDTYGHAAGDEVLRVVGHRIRASLRARDLVARVGGDEFNVLVDGIGSEDDVTRLARSLLGVVTEPVRYQGQSLALSASIGISFFPRDANDVDALVTHADMAMYEAKSRGRNNFQVFSSQISIAAKSRLTLVNGLRHAIERQEMTLHYQPHTDLVTGRILGFEALIRWNHPELGAVPPGHFVPIAEEIGVIDSISDWVLRTACAQGAAWRAQGMPDLVLAVNLSPRNFWDRDLPARVAQILSETGWPASLLCLEITEGTIMSRENPEESLRRLGDLGIRLAIDDFGVGYSSLGNLRRFPVDVLKIDRSFTSGIPEDADNLALVRTILALARGLGLTVIAEGIETRIQHDTLIAEGCLQGQGYLYGRPMPAEAIGSTLLLAPAGPEPERAAQACA